MSLSTNEQYLIRMLQRIADGSVGASTMRNMGPAGTIKVVREFLRKPGLLQSFASVTSRDTFEALLEKQTNILKKKLPGGSRYRKENYLGEWGERWGVARKCLNIFLYECVLNQCLREAHKGISKLEPWLEVPLDSYVGKGLNHEDTLDEIPAWGSVISLDKNQSRKYQDFAAKLAASENVARVHLDLKFYTDRGEE